MPLVCMSNGSMVSLSCELGLYPRFATTLTVINAIDGSDIGVLRLGFRLVG